MKEICIVALFAFVLGLSPVASFGQSDAKARKISKKVEKAMGGSKRLWARNDVEYNYDYSYPGMDKKDNSTERYIFDGEHSWAKYTRHDINTFPGESGDVVQSLVDFQPMVTLNGKKVDDPKALATTVFLRQANYFWFTMFFKFNDPGVIHKYLGTEESGGIDYQKISISYDSKLTGKEKNDSYILYVNPKTYLVDQFYFSLPARGVDKPVILMKLSYENFDGLTIATQRRIFQPGKDGKMATDPGLIQTLTKVKFDNGFKASGMLLNPSK